MIPVSSSVKLFRDMYVGIIKDDYKIFSCPKVPLKIPTTEGRGKGYSMLER